MMNIAVCDDEENWGNDIADVLRRNAPGSQISVFTDFEDLWNKIEQGAKFEIVCMDIEWNREKNGIDYARELYKRAPLIQIIYVTSYNDRFSEHIFLKPANLCGYLKKPVDEEILKQLLIKAEDNRRELEKNKILIQTKKSTVTVPTRNIIYLESDAHRLVIHTCGEDILCYEKMDTLMEALPRNFERCHKSYGVNMDYVFQLKGKEVLISDTCKLPISRSKYMEFKNRYFDYIGGEV